MLWRRIISQRESSIVSRESLYAGFTERSEVPLPGVFFTPCPLKGELFCFVIRYSLFVIQHRFSLTFSVQFNRSRSTTDSMQVSGT